MPTPTAQVSTISAVIPVHNEEESLDALVDELNQVRDEHSLELDILFVDDGSTDRSWEVIERLSQNNDHVDGIRFRGNFGKAAALSAGFSQAKGDIIFTLDGDLQDDPAEIPRFLEKLDQGYDCVSGWKKVRHDPWHKVGPSRVFNWMVGWLTGVKLHDHNCGFKCYRRGIFDEIHLYGEMHRFIPVLAASRGWRVDEIVVNHRERQFGYSKYGVRRIFKGFLDLLTVYLLTGFRQRPQHLFGGVGLICLALGGLGVTILTIAWIVTRVNSDPADDLHLTERAIFYYSMAALLLGAQLASLGALAELQTAQHVRQQPVYSIREQTTSGSAPTTNPSETSHDSHPSNQS